MNTPKITEEKLEKLLRCFVAEFSKEHANNTHKLSEKVFFLTDRMGCCKTAGLNYEYTASSKEGDLVNVTSSVYSQAVKELEHRGHLSFTDSNLKFVLTDKGFTYGNQELVKELSKWIAVKNWSNEHQGIAAFLGLGVAVVAVVIAL